MKYKTGQKVFSKEFGKGTIVRTDYQYRSIHGPSKGYAVHFLNNNRIQRNQNFWVIYDSEGRCMSYEDYPDYNIKPYCTHYKEKV